MNLRSSADQVLFTASPGSGAIALRELESADTGVGLLEWLSPGVGRAALERGWESLVGSFREHPPVFCRHICPVQVRIPVEQDASDLDRLTEGVADLIPQLDLTQSFSVQTRLLGHGWPYGRYDVNVRLADELRARGSPLDVRQPEQILSVVLTPAWAHLGLSRAVDNLSDWAGGARRFKREEGQISRAEFKLLEALELFRLSLPDGGTALDLGAAPGGWTRLLVQHAMRVIAVDPADLHPQIEPHSAVRHVRGTAQGYLSTSDERFDVILNDMRLDAQESARVMLTAAGNLKAGGWALVTLKLPMRKQADTAQAALDLLRERYEVIGARQLFHNRTRSPLPYRRAQRALRERAFALQLRQNPAMGRWVRIC